MGFAAKSMETIKQFECKRILDSTGSLSSLKDLFQSTQQKIVEKGVAVFAEIEDRPFNTNFGSKIIKIYETKTELGKKLEIINQENLTISCPDWLDKIEGIVSDLKTLKSTFSDLLKIDYNISVSDFKESLNSWANSHINKLTKNIDRFSAILTSRDHYPIEFFMVFLPGAIINILKCAQYDTLVHCDQIYRKTSENINESRAAIANFIPDFYTDAPNIIEKIASFLSDDFDLYKTRFNEKCIKNFASSVSLDVKRLEEIRQRILKNISLLKLDELNPSLFASLWLKTLNQLTCILADMQILDTSLLSIGKTAKYKISLKISDLMLGINASVLKDLNNGLQRLIHSLKSNIETWENNKLVTIAVESLVQDDLLMNDAIQKRSPFFAYLPGITFNRCIDLYSKLQDELIKVQKIAPESSSIRTIRNQLADFYTEKIRFAEKEQWFDAEIRNYRITMLNEVKARATGIENESTT